MAHSQHKAAFWLLCYSRARLIWSFTPGSLPEATLEVFLSPPRVKRGIIDWLNE